MYLKIERYLKIKDTRSVAEQSNNLGRAQRKDDNRQ
jgi:hypothetical protein